MHQCKNCNKMFDHPTKWAYCSDDCRYIQSRLTSNRYNSISRAKQNGFDITPEIFTSIEIYERDKWRCGICGEQVDIKLPFPDKMSASIDHIIPLRQGGKHVRENVRCAHLICNAIQCDPKSERKCKQCGIIYANTYGRYYCSPECSKKANLIRTNEWQRKHKRLAGKSHAKPIIVKILWFTYSS